MNISASVLANWWRRKPTREEDVAEAPAPAHVPAA
jgi:hypothetical protein